MTNLDPATKAALRNLPPAALLPEPLAKLVREQDRLRGALAAAAAELRGLREELRLAEDRDKSALAAALRGGKPDPGERNAQKAIERLRTAERRASALEFALSSSGAELVQVVARDRGAWLTALAGDEAAAAQGALDAADALAEAERRLGEVRALQSWARRFPSAKSWWLADPVVPDLRDGAGDPMRVGEVIEAVRRAVRPPIGAPEPVEAGVS